MSNCDPIEHRIGNEWCQLRHNLDLISPVVAHTMAIVYLFRMAKSFSRTNMSSLMLAHVYLKRRRNNPTDSTSNAHDVQIIKHAEAISLSETKPTVRT